MSLGGQVETKLEGGYSCIKVEKQWSKPQASGAIMASLETNFINSFSS